MFQYKHLWRILLAWIALCILVLVIGSNLKVHHGLMRTVVGAPGYEPSATWPWPYFDGADYSYADFLGGAHGVRFEGIVWQGAAGQTTWRIIHSHEVTVRVNGEIVYQVSGDMPITAKDIPITWNDRWLRIEIEYPHGPRPAGGDNRDEMGIYERTVWGTWRLLPNWRLYSEIPDAAFVAHEKMLYALTHLAWIGVFVGMIIWLVCWIRHKRLWTRRDVWLIGGIVLIALVVRVTVVLNRAQVDPYFYYFPPGDDNYVLLGRMWLAGQYSLAGTYWQPGTFVWLGNIMSLLGPHVLKLYLANAFLGSLSVGAVAGAGQIAFGRRVGVIAGLVAALYSLLAFYHTTLHVDGLSSSMTAFVVLAGLWAACHSTWRSAAFFGITTGLTALIRPTALIFGPAIAVALFAARDRTAVWHGWQKIIKLTGIAALFALLTISPQTLANWSVGSRALINGTGPVTFYTGNNRDADGTTGLTQALSLAEMKGKEWNRAALEDFLADPVRALALLLHKVGLFWQNVGASNVVFYLNQGIDTTLLLRVLSLNGLLGMTPIGWLGLTGLAILFLDPDQRRTTAPWMLASLLVLLMLGTVAYLIAERHRIPALPLLCIAAGVSIDRLLQILHSRRPDRKLGLAGGIALGLILMAYLCERYLPPKRFFYGDLPSGSEARSVDFGGQMYLLGFTPYDTDRRPGGYFYVTFDWQLLAPTADDLMVSVQLLGPAGDRVAWADATVGAISYPKIGTSHWPVGAKLAEGYLIKLPKDAPSVMDIYVDLYDPDTGDRLPIVDANGTPTNEDRIRLGRLGILTAEGIPALEDPITEVDYRLGESMHMTGFNLPQSVSLPNDLPVGVRIETTGPVYEDYVLFFHLLNEAGQAVAQSDSPILNGDWTTAALIPQQPLGAVRLIDLPDDLPPGKYRLVMGMYSYPSLERLAVWDRQDTLLPDGLIAMGWVSVK